MNECIMNNDFLASDSKLQSEDRQDKEKPLEKARTQIEKRKVERNREFRN
jgi:hypothetical protein